MKEQTNANQRQCTPQSGISAYETWLNLRTHAVSETENRTSCLTTVSQTITVSSCQSDGGGGGGTVSLTPRASLNDSNRPQPL